MIWGSCALCCCTVCWEFDVHFIIALDQFKKMKSVNLFNASFVRQLVCHIWFSIKMQVLHSRINSSAMVDIAYSNIVL